MTSKKILNGPKAFPLTLISLLGILLLTPGRLLAADSLEAAKAFDPFAGFNPQSFAAFPDAVLAIAADPAQGTDAVAGKVYYVDSWQVDLSRIPAPPAAGSAQDKEDMSAVHKWQNERTDAQCAAAGAQKNGSYEEFFGAVSPFGTVTPADAAKFFDHVKIDAGAVALTLKQKYKRPRPFERDSTLNPCIGRESGYSYPSGHATVSRVFGRILSDFVPRDSATFMAYADQGALNRVIGGVHHPTDVEQGKQVGDLIYQALLKNPTFNSDMASLRKYLAH